MGHFNLTPSALADAIGVPRSSMSHLLSGRNRPSLDFILKLVNKFPEIDLYWLLNGKGEFPASQEDKTSKIKYDQEGVDALGRPTLSTDGKQASKIVIFYNDGTFESFQPKK